MLLNTCKACPTGFKKSLKKYTTKEKEFIASILENKEAKTCSKQCRDSKFCTAFLISEPAKKSGSKDSTYICRMYYKGGKGLEKEVPVCATGNKNNNRYFVNRINFAHGFKSSV